MKKSTLGTRWADTAEQYPSTADPQVYHFVNEEVDKQKERLVSGAIGVVIGIVILTFFL